MGILDNNTRRHWEPKVESRSPGPEPHCHPKGSGSGFGMNNTQSGTTGWQAILWWDRKGQILLEDTRDLKADGEGWAPGFSGG